MSITQNQSSIKKTFSFILTHIHFRACPSTDDNEMYEFIPHTTSEENLSTIHRSESSLSDNTVVNQQSSSVHSTPRTTHRHPSSMHRTFSHLKNKFKASRHEHIDDSDKNHDYVVVGNSDAELAILPQDSLDLHETRHAQPCLQTDEVSFDLNKIQYETAAPMKPNPSPSQEEFLGSSRILVGDQSNHALVLQSTRSSDQCAIPQDDLLNIHNTQTLQEATTSPTSTNSLHHAYVNIDRSLLTDQEFVEAQKLDLEALIVTEIQVAKQNRDLRTVMENEREYNDLYEQALRTNSELKEELRQLQEEYKHTHSSWLCRYCFSLNEPYSTTQKDVCENCGSPSPLKDLRLMK